MVRFRRAASVDEASAAADDDASVLVAGGIGVAGGRATLDDSACLVAIGHLDALSGVVRASPRGVRIGAVTTHAEVSRDPLVRASVPGLSEAVDAIGPLRVRCQGTVGGNLSSRESRYDWPSLLLALDGHLLHVSSGEERHVAAADWVASWRSPSPLGLLVGVELPDVGHATLVRHVKHGRHGVAGEAAFVSATARADLSTTPGVVSRFVVAGAGCPPQEFLPSGKVVDAGADELTAAWADVCGELSEQLGPRYARSPSPAYAASLAAHALLECLTGTGSRYLPGQG